MLNYLLESSVCLAVFYVAFLFIYRQDPYLARNRIYLIFSMILSLIIPLLSIPSAGMVQEISKELPVDITVLQADSVIITGEGETAGLSNWLVVYWIGFSASLLYLLIRLVIMFQRIRNFEKSIIDGIEVRLTNGNMPTSVFFNTMLWNNNSKLSHAEQSAVLAHEMAHIQQCHGYDIFFVELLKVWFWFNPVIYLFEGLLKQQHEFLSDKEAVNRIDKSNYQNLIVNQMFSSLNLGLTSNFGQPTVKNRLIMLQKEAINPILKWKILVIVPFILMLVFFYSCDQFDEGLAVGPQKVDNGSLFVKYQLLDQKSVGEADLSDFGNGVIVSGNVSSKSGPLPGTAIVLSGTTTGTTTDMEGNFQFYLTEERRSGTLIFAFVDHETLRVDLGSGLSASK